MSENLSAAADALKCSRTAIYNHIEKAPRLKQVLQEERERMVDVAESSLRREVIKGNITAIIWTLKASPEAKKRGWGERQEIMYPSRQSRHTPQPEI